MSQYDCSNPSHVFAGMNDMQLAQLAAAVKNFHKDMVSPRWNSVAGIESYVMDVEFVAGKTPQIHLIELNYFGGEMAAGSPLFHWIRDAHELYNSDRLCIRILSNE